MLSCEHLRAWMLLLLRAATIAGLTPLPIAVFHRLVFLSNTLASLYDTKPPSEFVLKHERGPYYPAAQFEMERLAVQGLVAFSVMEWSTSSVDGQLTVKFALTQTGRDTVNQWISDVSWCASVLEYLTDLCMAVGNVSEGEEIAVVDQDLTYSQDWASKYSVISFRYPMERLSERASEEIARAVPSMASPSRQSMLRMYLKLLERRAA